jgi:hypothetical protein
MRGVFNNDIKVKNAIMDTLRYYVVFQLPLKADEIFCQLSTSCTFSSLLVALEDLEEAKIIYKYGGYYSLERDIKRLVLQRKIANN